MTMFVLWSLVKLLALVVFIDGERVRARAESDALLLNVLPRPIAPTDRPIA